MSREALIIHPRYGVEARRIERFLVGRYQQPGMEDSPRTPNPLVNADMEIRKDEPDTLQEVANAYRLQAWEDVMEFLDQEGVPRELSWPGVKATLGLLDRVQLLAKGEKSG